MLLNALRDAFINQETLRLALSRTQPREEPAANKNAGVALVIVPGPAPGTPYAPGTSGAEPSFGLPLDLLLIRRAEHPRDPWSGQIGLPGGMKEPADADLLATAVRETAEETGVELPPSSLIGRLDDCRPRRNSLPDVMIRPHVFFLEKRPETRCSAELQYCFWAPLPELAKAHEKVELVSSSGNRRTEAYRAANGDLVWGITYGILSEFFRKAALSIGTIF